MDGPSGSPEEVGVADLTAQSELILLAQKAQEGLLAALNEERFAPSAHEESLGSAILFLASLQALGATEVRVSEEDVPNAQAREGLRGLFARRDAIERIPQLTNTEIEIVKKTIERLRSGDRPDDAAIIESLKLLQKAVEHRVALRQPIKFSQEELDAAV